jgi:hypothetical protein
MAFIEIFLIEMFANWPPGAALQALCPRRPSRRGADYLQRRSSAPAMVAKWGTDHHFRKMKNGKTWSVPDFPAFGNLGNVDGSQGVDAGGGHAAGNSRSLLYFHS